MTSATRPTGVTPAMVAKHMPRRSTLVRKRDDDDIPQPSSPSKRSKVSFDSDVEVRIVEEWEKSPAVIQDSVRRAIHKHATGDSASYERVKFIYAPTKGDQDIATPTTIRNYTAALLSNVSLLDKKCADLVHAVLDSDWLGRSADYVQLFTQFLANLVSAQGLFLPNVLRMLADNLTSSKLSSSCDRDVGGLIKEHKLRHGIATRTTVPISHARKSTRVPTKLYSISFKSSPRPAAFFFRYSPRSSLIRATQGALISCMSIICSTSLDTPQFSKRIS